METRFEAARLTGKAFPTNEAICIQLQAKVLSDKYKQPTIDIWGKILGSTADYIILRAYGKDLVGGPQHILYSVDNGISFSTLSCELTSEKAVLSSEVKGAFMGDPSYEYKVAHPTTGEVIPIKESERLSWFISACDAGCRITPRGSVVQYEDGCVAVNKAFEGLDRGAAGRTDSYIHLRKDRRTCTLLQTEGTLKKLDFLDPISIDEPKVIWNIKYDAPEDIIYGTNLKFPGAMFYHRPGTRIYGNIYMGDGIVNSDMAFML